MAWVTQKFEYRCLGVELDEGSVEITSGESIYLTPENSQEAHAWAMMLRRAARRLEEIGKELL